MSILTKEEILNFPKTTYGRALGKTIASKVMNELLQYKDLEEQIGCPLDLVLIPYFISGLKKVWYHNQWCDVVRIVAYEEATTPYMEVRCKDYDYLKFIPLTNYKKTFWLKEDKSE